MNMRQARAYVLRCLAAEARQHPGNGSEWLDHPLKSDNITTTEDDQFTEADHARLVRAVYAIADELDARAKRLAQPSRRGRGTPD